MAKFRLEPVLKLRKYREEARKRDLAAAVSEEQRHKDVVLRLANFQLEQSQVFRRQQGAGPLDMLALIAQKQYLGLLDREIRFGLKSVARAEHETARHRGKVAGAMQDRKALEILQGRALEAALAEQRRAEMAELDEAGLRIVRGGNEATLSLRSGP